MRKNKSIVRCLFLGVFLSSLFGCAAGKFAASNPKKNNPSTTQPSADDSEKDSDKSAPPGSINKTDGDCVVYKNDPTDHALLDALNAQYPRDALPQVFDEVANFRMSLHGVAFPNAVVQTGNEYVDPINGGITEANVNLGLQAAQQRAVSTLPAAVNVRSIKNLPAKVESSYGYAFGSIVYETGAGEFFERGYFYYGFYNSKDIELFLVAEKNFLVKKSCE